MESIEKLITNLNKLPGIGIKTAQRLAYHMIAMPDESIAALAESILEAKRRIHFCPVCGNYTENELCEICSNPKRNPKQTQKKSICVLLMLERTVCPLIRLKPCGFPKLKSINLI